MAISRRDNPSEPTAERTNSTARTVKAGSMDVDFPPAVSVVMPVYNGERYLAEAIESMLAQTFGDFEFIIVNDGSTDRSREIIGRYQARDRRIRVIDQSNSGIVAALNAGLQAARGEFIARMDADDLSHPDRLQRQLEFLRCRPDCIAVGSSILLIDADGDPICASSRLQDHTEIMSGLLQGVCTIAHPTVVLRTEAVRRVDGYRREFQWAEDVDLWLRLGEVGQLSNLPDVLLNYRLHLQSVSSERATQQACAYSQAVLQSYERRGASPPKGLIESIAGRTSPQGSPAQCIVHAVIGRNMRTARKHARQLLRQRPWFWKHWLLFAAAIAGPVSAGPLGLLAKIRRTMMRPRCA